MTVRSEVLMGTIVTIRVLHAHAGDAIERAFGWFREIESRCTRFDEQSELMQLTARVGEAVHPSAIVFEAVRFAITVAEETGGAFDPTLGRYRDVVIDPDRHTITLLRPVTFDLGAVAKGLAIDTAARELQPLANFSIDAGGDLYLGGCNPRGEPWSVGIQHPRIDDGLIDTLRISNQAVCTSGDYERGNHILDPRNGAPATAVASATVIAPTAMLADAVATAAFVLGPAGGIELIERMGLEGLIVTPSLERHETRGLCRAR